MARPRGIPDRLIEAVLQQAGNGASSRDIAAWLKAKHNVKVGHTAVARMLRERRSERKAAAEAVIAERTAKSLTADLDVLDAQLVDTRKVTDALRDKLIDPTTGKPTDFIMERIGASPVVDVYMRAVGRVESIVATKMKNSGIGDPGEGGAPGGVGGVVIYLPEKDDDA